MRTMFCLNGPDEMNGPNSWLLRHLPLMRDRGAMPEILYLSYEPERPCRNRDRLASLGFRVRSARLGRFTEETVQAIVAAVDGDLPDVFVPNYSVPAYFAARFLREAGVRTIGILHSDDPYYHDLFELFVAGPPAWRLSGVVAVSEYLASLVREHRDASALPPVAYAPCGTPLPRDTATAPNGTLTILYAGRLVEYQKRISRVAQRLCDAAEAVPTVRGVLYGRGEQETAVAAILARRRGGERVRLGGPLAPDQVLPAMLRGHVFTLLSDFEGLSIALLEAMAAGLVPIVPPLRSGASDVIVNGANGFVVDPDEPGMFVDAVRQLRSTPGLWGRMSARARATIRDGGFTSEACAERWVAFCRTLDAPDAPPHKAHVADVDTWDLPARATRVDGIAAHDRRTIDTQIRAAVQSGRPLYLWGAGTAGRRFLESRPGWRRHLHGIVDSDAARQGTDVEGLHVVAPDVLDPRPVRPFVIITSMHHAAIVAALEQRRFTEGVDFVAA